MQQVSDAELFRAFQRPWNSSSISRVVHLSKKKSKSESLQDERSSLSKWQDRDFVFHSDGFLQYFVNGNCRGVIWGVPMTQIRSSDKFTVLKFASIKSLSLGMVKKNDVQVKRNRGFAVRSLVRGDVEQLQAWLQQFWASTMLVEEESIVSEEAAQEEVLRKRGPSVVDTNVSALLLRRAFQCLDMGKTVYDTLCLQEAQVRENTATIADIHFKLRQCNASLNLLKGTDLFGLERKLLKSKERSAFVMGVMGKSLPACNKIREKIGAKVTSKDSLGVSSIVQLMEVCSLQNPDEVRRRLRLQDEDLDKTNAIMSELVEVSDMIGRVLKSFNQAASEFLAQFQEAFALLLRCQFKVCGILGIPDSLPPKPLLREEKQRSGSLLTRIGSAKISRKARAASTESRVSLRKSLDIEDVVVEKALLEEKKHETNLFDYSSVESSKEEESTMFDQVLSFFQIK